MSESLRNNPIALRSCILYDFLRKKSAKESFDKLCSVVERDAILWAEFNFWLDRFENGNFDLELETESLAKIHLETKLEELKISAEPKILEFSDLTTDVLKAIIDELQLKERLILRKVSRGLRALVDQQKSIVKGIDIECHVDHIRLEFNHDSVFYAKPKCRLMGFRNNFYCQKFIKVIESEDYLKSALGDLEIALKNPKLQLDLLCVDFFHGDLAECTQKLEAVLKSLNHKISTKAFEVRTESAKQILAVLPYLNPDTLLTIGFRQYEASLRISDAEFEKIAELDQWKQAKCLSLKCPSEMLPEKHLMHFEEFSISGQYMSLADILKWRDLSSKSKNFKKGEISPTNCFYLEQILKKIGDGVPILLRDEFSDPIYVIEHPILDDPNRYLEIKVWLVHDQIVFEKLSRQSS